MNAKKFLIYNRYNIFKYLNILYFLIYLLVLFAPICANATTPCPMPLPIDYYMKSASDIFVGSVVSSTPEVTIVKVVESFKGTRQIIPILYFDTYLENIPNDTLLLLHVENAREVQIGCETPIILQNKFTNQRLTELRLLNSERKRLETAVASQPSDVASLIALAKFYEHIDSYQAQAAYSKALTPGNGTEVLEGFIRTLGMEDGYWSVLGLDMAYKVLEHDPSNALAKRLRDQALIHAGHIEIIDTADLSYGKFKTLNLVDRHIPHVNLKGTIITELLASNADLAYADFSGVTITQSILPHANLENALLKNTELKNAVISHANFSKTIGLKLLTSSNAAGASFAEADLTSSHIDITEHGIIFPLRPFYGRYLDTQDNELTAQSGSKPLISFMRANLSHALIRISGMRIDFSGANLTEATFQYSDLRGADFSAANLGQTKFNQCVYDESTKWPLDFVLSGINGLVNWIPGKTPRF